MAFWDRDHGIAMSDPVDGRFLIITTDDGGKTWNQVPAAKYSARYQGRRRLCGKRHLHNRSRQKQRVVRKRRLCCARVSLDRQRPHVAGRNDSDHKRHGIGGNLFNRIQRCLERHHHGGDYRKPGEAGDNVATTADGGRTWKLAQGTRA